MFEDGYVVNSISVNQDNTIFVVSTNKGYRVYNVDPIKLRYQFDGIDGGLVMAEIYKRSNLLLLVGTGQEEKDRSGEISGKGKEDEDEISYPRNAVVVWDDRVKKSYGRIICEDDVAAIKINTNHIIVVSGNVLCTYDIESLKIVGSPHFAGQNPVIAMSPNIDEKSLICTTTDVVGQIVIKDIVAGNNLSIKAHVNKITNITFSNNCKYVATASECGTLIRIFNVYGGDRMREFRRGGGQANIYGINFCPNDDYLNVYSDTSTLHIYNVSGSGDKKGPSNITSNLSFLKNFLGYTGSQWSFMKLTVPSSGSKYVCLFTPSGYPDGLNIVIIYNNGDYRKYAANIRHKTFTENSKLSWRSITADY